MPSVSGAVAIYTLLYLTLPKTFLVARVPYGTYLGIVAITLSLLNESQGAASGGPLSPEIKVAREPGDN